MKYFPQDIALRKHIDHYWIVRDAEELFKNTPPIYGYPGITPELFITLEGSFSYFYNGEKHKVDNNKLFSFIHSEVILDTRLLKSFVIVQFKPRALSSIMPFVKQNSKDLMSWPICDGKDIYGDGFDRMLDYIRTLESAEIINALDQFFHSNFKSSREGFISEMTSELSTNASLKEIMALTKYSYSTLDRYFKKDTGLSPKQFQSLRRYKAAVQEIYGTRNPDWMHYVNKYDYFDQSHFIKDIKRYTTFTPAQLLATPGLISFRPENL